MMMGFLQVVMVGGEYQGWYCSGKEGVVLRGKGYGQTGLPRFIIKREIGSEWFGLVFWIRVLV